MTDTNIRYVVDASYFGSYLLPDEHVQSVADFFRDHSDQKFLIFAPELLQYEVANIIRNAVLQKRLMAEDAGFLLDSFLYMVVEYVDVSMPEVFNLACEKRISCYDASYVWLAQSLKVPLLTLDEKLQKLCV